MWVRVHLQSLKLRIPHYFQQGIPWHSGNYRVWIHSETCAWHDKNIQSNVPYRQLLATQLSHLVSLAKWLSVCLWTNLLWVRAQLKSLRWFLMEIYFCRPRVIHGLFLNFNFCLEIFLRGACKSKIKLSLVRKLTKDWSTFPLFDLVKFSQSTDR